MRCSLLLAVVLSAVVLAGCATEYQDSAPPRVRVGMSRDDVQFFFGTPSRIESAPSGGEDWYYTFRTWAPQAEAGSSGDAFEGRSDTASLTLPTQKITQEYVIHLSPDGHVIEPVPEGDLGGR